MPVLVESLESRVLRGNPLDDISNTGRIAGVVIGGRWLARAEIDQRLQSRR